VRDAAGVTQVLNPIVNLVSGQPWKAGVYTTRSGSPATTLIPGTNRWVPRLEHQVRLLERKVTGPFDPQVHLLFRDPLAVIWDNPRQPILPNEFKDAGAVLTIRDASDPPVEASWAVDYNTERLVVALANSGPDLSKVPFQQGPYTVEVAQGITRNVAPGDVQFVTEVQIEFDEALDPTWLQISDFQMWSATDTPSGLQFTVVPPASTLRGAYRQGITHEIQDGRSVVTLRPKSAFSPAWPGRSETIVLTLNTAEPGNAAPPARVKAGLRDLNGFALAYPMRTGWVLNVDASNNPTTVAYVEPLEYRNQHPFPGNIEVVWAFQTRVAPPASSAITESFVDTRTRSPDCPSTAAWTLAGQPGLYATCGYGGNGERGDAVITGAVTYDSDTMTPGPDGVVALDFHRFAVAPTGTVTFKGKYPFRLNAIQNMAIDGVLDVSGIDGRSAPPGKAITVGRLPGGRGGAGAGAGGDSNTNPNEPIGALPMDLRGGPGWPRVIELCTETNRSENRRISPFEPNCGGGPGGNRGLPADSTFRCGCSGNGGGHAGPASQSDVLCGRPSYCGVCRGDAWVVTTGTNAVQAPTAGTGGGAGGNAMVSWSSSGPEDDIVAGSGGGGGGGLELVSAGSLTVSDTAKILATGGSGGRGHSIGIGNDVISGGWGGGGSGGSIWLSGTSVRVLTRAVLDARGGIGNPGPPTPSWSGGGGDGYVIVRDRGGNPDIASDRVTPAAVAGRARFDPPNNGRSVAFSAWYDSRRSDPRWSFDASDPQTGYLTGGRDLILLNPPASGQYARISFQAAPDGGGVPNPDPRTWHPPNPPEDPCAAWETDLRKIPTAGGFRHLRFKFTFDIGPREKGRPPPNQIAIARVVIHF